LLWTIFSAFFMVFGVGGFIKESNEYNRLSTEGVSASAAVTQLRVDDSGDSTSYYVHYQYTGLVSGDPTRFDASDSISSSLYRSLKVGQAIEIIYAASDPALSAVQTEFGPPNLLLNLGVAGIAGLFILIGLVLLYTGSKTMNQLSQLRAHGRQTEAVVFDRWKEKDSDGDPTYLVAFAFKVPTPNGGQRVISHAEQNVSLYKKYNIGDAFTIRYLPEDPSVCQPRIER